MADKPPFYQSDINSAAPALKAPPSQGEGKGATGQLLNALGINKLISSTTPEGGLGSLLNFGGGTDLGLSTYGSEAAAEAVGAAPNMSMMGGGVGEATGLGGAPVSPGIGTYAIPALGAYGLYDAISNDREGIRGYGQSVASGAAAGSFAGPPGMIVGAILGGLSKAGQDLFDSGKPQEQKARDSARDVLKRMGVVSGPEKGAATLETLGGDTLDIGVDGGGRGSYNVDFTNPLAPQAAALVNPLAAIVAAKSGAKKEQVAGWLANGILQNNKEPGSLVKEAQFLYRKMGVGPQEIVDELGKLYAQGKISKNEIDSFTASIRGLSQNGQNLRTPQ